VKGLFYLMTMEQEIRAQIELLKNNISEADPTEIITYLDYTSLRSIDSKESIIGFCSQANTYQENHGNVPIPAICVYPNWVEIAKKELNPSILVACVSTGFPEGQTFGTIKQLETQLAMRAGADEVDMVIHRGAFLSGDFEFVENEVRMVKEVVGEKHLKVILEVCDLPDAASVMKAAELSISGGADFIKTSTGKGSHGATPDSFFAMCLEVDKHFSETGRRIGLKAAGGIRTLEDAWLYRSIVAHVLGEEWLTPNLFRIGTSSLARIAEEIAFPNQKHYL
jgi:deoxyribose-phosphate aldolase